MLLVAYQMSLRTVSTVRNCCAWEELRRVDGCDTGRQDVWGGNFPGGQRSETIHMQQAPFGGLVTNPYSYRGRQRNRLDTKGALDNKTCVVNA